jgi:hypothetical protein
MFYLFYYFWVYFEKLSQIVNGSQPGNLFRNRTWYLMDQTVNTPRNCFASASGVVRISSFLNNFCKK